MSRKTSNTVLLISAALLAVSGLILLLMSIASEKTDNRTLNFAIASIFLSNLFSPIRIQRNQKDRADAEEKRGNKK